MSKFKVGDKVRCISSYDKEYRGNDCPMKDQIYTIDGYTDEDFPILEECSLNNHNYWDDDSFELIEFNEAVNSPSHYQSKKFEVIEVIEEFNLDFSLGNAIKYILRAGKKDEQKYKEDLEKAIWYINRHIKGIDNA